MGLAGKMDVGCARNGRLQEVSEVPGLSKWKGKGAFGQDMDLEGTIFRGKNQVLQ